MQTVGISTMTYDQSDYQAEIERLLKKSKQNECLVCHKFYKSITHHLESAHKKEYLKAKETKTLLYAKTQETCKFCDFQPSTTQSLVSHIRKRHIKIMVVCDICGLSVSKDWLSQHKKNKHSEDAYNWKCKICNQNYKTEITYKRHLGTSSHLDKVKLFEIRNGNSYVEDDIQEIKIKVNLKTDPNFITKLKPYIPPESGPQTKKENFHVYAGEKVTCSYCVKKFDIRNFNNHINEKHKYLHEDTETNITKFECTKCSQKFEFDTLLEHSKTHGNIPKKFQCNLCNYSSHTLYHLTRHQKNKHPTEDTQYYKCTECNFCSTRKDTVKRHIKNVHNRVYVECEFCKQQIQEREYKERHRTLCETKMKIKMYPGSSSWERTLSKYFIENDITFECQYKCEDLISDKGKYLPFDFYLPDYDTIIEVNGLYHYELSSHKNAQEILDRNIRHDKLKIDYANKNFSKVVVIDTRYYKTHTLEKELENIMEILENN